MELIRNKCLRKFLGKRFDGRWAYPAHPLSTLIFHKAEPAPREYRHLRVARYIFAVFILISSRQTQIHNSTADNQKDEPLARDALEEHLFWSAVRTRRFSPLLDSSAAREPETQLGIFMSDGFRGSYTSEAISRGGRWKYVQDTSRVEQQYKWPHETFKRGYTLSLCSLVD